MTRVNGVHGPGRHFEPPNPGNPFSDLTHSMIALVEQYNTMTSSEDVDTVRRAALEMDQHMNCVRSDLSAVLVALAVYPSRSQRRAGAGRVETQPPDDGGKALPDE